MDGLTDAVVAGGGGIYDTVIHDTQGIVVVP